MFYLWVAAAVACPSRGLRVLHSCHGPYEAQAPSHPLRLCRRGGAGRGRTGRPALLRRRAGAGGQPGSHGWVQAAFVSSKLLCSEGDSRGIAPAQLQLLAHSRPCCYHRLLLVLPPCRPRPLPGPAPRERPLHLCPVRALWALCAAGDRQRPRNEARAAEQGERLLESMRECMGSLLLGLAVTAR